MNIRVLSKGVSCMNIPMNVKTEMKPATILKQKNHTRCRHRVYEVNPCNFKPYNRQPLQVFPSAPVSFSECGLVH